MDFESQEAASFWRFIASSLDRLVQVATSIDPDGLRWRPPVPETNSIAVLVTHTLGNAEENILEILCGQAVHRNREAEFAERTVDADALAAQWAELRPRLESVLAQLASAELHRERRHPRRGSLTGREVLIVVARHAAEHLGQAELTRDLWLAMGDNRFSSGP